MNAPKFLIIAMCALTLSACESTWQGLQDDLGNINTSSWDLPTLSDKSDPTSDQFVNGNCPAVTVVEELNTVNEFADINNPGSYNLISQATMTKAKGACDFNGKIATVDIQLIFEGKTGPKSQGVNNFSYPFFVAVTAPNGNILAKEVFSAPLNYTSGGGNASHSESLRQIIPIANQAQGPEYKILIGFQLTQEQLAHNRTVMAQKEADAAAKAAMEKAGIHQQTTGIQPTAPTTQNPATISTQDITKPIIIRNPQ